MKKILILLSYIASVLLPQMVFSKPFIIGQLQGQLGNQMFQIAATIAHAKNYDMDFYFPDLINKKSEGIPVNRKKIFFRIKLRQAPLKQSRLYEESCFEFTPLPFHPRMCINGYFQSEKYFENHAETIKELFAPSEEILNYLHKNYEDIINHPKSVAIHVRTYHSEPHVRAVFPLHGREYVEKAVQYFPTDCLFVVFSDDIPWCEENLIGIRPNMRFIKGEQYYHDFFLISLCKHQIISNSSFSWWAAYLNKNPKKVVVAPKKWFQDETGLNYKDLVPEGWHRLE